MKRFYALLLLVCLVLTLAACGQQTKTVYVKTKVVTTILGRELRYEYTYSANGKPKTIKSYLDGELYQSASSRTNGNINYLTLTDRNDKQQVQTTEYFYDDQGRVIEEDIYINGYSSTNNTYTYDEAGHLVKILAKGTNATVTTEYTYDENGLVTAQTQTVTGEEPDFSHIVYTYNEKGWVILEQIYGEDQVLESYNEYVYEGEFHSVMTTFRGDGTPDGTVTAKTFDEHGNLIEELITIDGEEAQKTVNTYEAMEVPVDEGKK